METPILPDKGKLSRIIFLLDELNNYREIERKALLLNNVFSYQKNSSNLVNEKYDKQSAELKECQEYLNTLVTKDDLTDLVRDAFRAGEALCAWQEGYGDRSCPDEEDEFINKHLK